MTSGDPVGTASWSPQAKQGLRVSALGCPANLTFQVDNGVISGQSTARPSSSLGPVRWSNQDLWMSLRRESAEDSRKAQEHIKIAKEGRAR